MPDENRFAGLSDAVGDEESDDSEEPGTETGTTETQSGVDARSDAEERADPTGSTDSAIEGSDNSVESENIGHSGDTVDSANIGESVNSSDIADGAAVRNDPGSDETGAEADDIDGNRRDRVRTSNSDSAQSVNIVDSPDDGDGAIGTDADDGAVGQVSAGDPAPIDEPAFAFDETEQHSMYVRPDVWQQFEDVKALVDARLRTEHDVRDLTGREFQDAVLRIAADHEDELVDAIVAARTND